MCQRQVSLSQTARAGAARSICENSVAPMSIEIGYFSRFSPYVPATPQQLASFSTTRSPGTSAMRSSAGLPIPWPCCWRGGRARRRPRLRVWGGAGGCVALFLGGGENVVLKLAALVELEQELDDVV